MEAEKLSTVTLSPSKAVVWVHCRKQYYWRYVRNLALRKKASPPTVGQIISKTFELYYNVPFKERSANFLTSCLIDAVLENKANYLKSNFSEGEDQVRLEWSRIEDMAKRSVKGYHEWASIKDKDLTVVSAETTYKIALSPTVFLLAIPDTLVVQDDFKHVLEHKWRGQPYNSGDFGIDYQSWASCLVTGSIGTMYNVLTPNTARTPFIRDFIPRTGAELSFAKALFLNVGEDILTTPVENLYPQPIKRCRCDYWELCVQEIEGWDYEDIIKECYVPYKKTLKEEKVIEVVEGE